MNYIEITNHAINIDGNYISFDESIIEKTIFFDDRLYVFVKEKDDYQQNVFAIDLQEKKVLWKIQENSPIERDFKNPYNGLLSKLSSSDYIVFNKWDSWRVAVDRDTGKIREDIDLNTGNRPW